MIQIHRDEKKQITSSVYNLSTFSDCLIIVMIVKFFYLLCYKYYVRAKGSQTARNTLLGYTLVCAARCWITLYCICYSGFSVIEIRYRIVCGLHLLATKMLRCCMLKVCRINRSKYTSSVVDYACWCLNTTY